jgi:DNA-binding response OmpR family regulator
MPKIRILYAEDEVFLGKIVKESLESREFEVWMEHDGGSVLDAFSRWRPDVCVLDIMLPNKDGFELADGIRRLDERVPILFVTAKTQTDDVVRGFSAGANDYIRKPFSMEELIVRIQNALRRGNNGHAGIGADTVSLGRYRFQPRKQALTLQDAERKLSFRESELLRYLYEHRDIVIPRKDILLVLWGNDSFFNSRNLDVYIAKLRGYLAGDDAVDIITIKGIGYRFVID